MEEFWKSFKSVLGAAAGVILAVGAFVLLFMPSTACDSFGLRCSNGGGWSHQRSDFRPAVYQEDEDDEGAYEDEDDEERTPRRTKGFHKRRIDDARTRGPAEKWCINVRHPHWKRILADHPNCQVSASHRQGGTACRIKC